MNDEGLIEPFSVQEIFVDGFTAHRTHDGVMTCVGYRKTKEGRLVVVRLVWPEVNTTAAIVDATAALAGQPPPETGQAIPKRDCH